MPRKTDQQTAIASNATTRNPRHDSPHRSLRTKMPNPRLSLWRAILVILRLIYAVGRVCSYTCSAPQTEYFIITILDSKTSLELPLAKTPTEFPQGREPLGTNGEERIHVPFPDLGHSVRLETWAGYEVRLRSQALFSGRSSMPEMGLPSTSIAS
jgi:hypothetical protein